VRNVLIGMGNSGDPGLADVATALLSDTEPEVRGAAVWALQRLAPERVASLAATRLPLERDADVRNEWAEAIGETSS
jgi:epoxyqueuosine reductase